MFKIDVLTSYSFLVVAIGTLLLAISSAALGTITVLKGQSLIGDAIGPVSYTHLTLPTTPYV